MEIFVKAYSIQTSSYLLGSGTKASAAYKDPLLVVAGDDGILCDHHNQGVVGSFRIQVVVGAYCNQVEVGVDLGRTLEVVGVVDISSQTLRQVENPSR